MSTLASWDDGVADKIGRVRIERSGNEIELRCRPSQWGAGCFLVLWLTGWSAGCAMLLKKVVEEPVVRNIAFAVPFFASWLLVACLVCYLFFSVQRLHIGPEGVEYTLSIFAPLRRRLVPLREIKGVTIGKTAAMGQENQRQDCLVIETQSQPINFGAGTTDGDLRRLAALVRKGLASQPGGADVFAEQKGNRATKEEDDDTPTDESGEEDADEPILGELLELQREPFPRPSDTRLRVQREFDGLEIRVRGQWKLGTLAMATFITLFWDGIVSVFVLELLHNFQWFLFVFLIPFEAIGLFFIAMWLAALFAPAITVRWNISQFEVTRRRAFFGFGTARVTSLAPLKGVLLKPPPEGDTSNNSPKGLGQTAASFTAGGDYGLDFVDINDNSMVTLDYLSEAEARWIADTLLREFPRWFSRH